MQFRPIIDVAILNICHHQCHAFPEKTLPINAEAGPKSSILFVNLIETVRMRLVRRGGVKVLCLTHVSK
jgi:hypothetical protein